MTDSTTPNADGLTPQEQAYKRYRYAPSKGTKNFIDADALSEGFVKYVNGYVQRPLPDHRADSIGEPTLSMLDELSTKVFIPIYEAGLVNRAPSFQFFQMDHVIDLGRQPDGSGKVDWGTITNQFEIVYRFFNSDPTKIVLMNAQLQYYEVTKTLVFVDQDGLESVGFTRAVTPSGVDCWHVEHFYQVGPKKRTLETYYMTEIQL